MGRNCCSNGMLDEKVCNECVQQKSVAISLIPARAGVNAKAW